MKWGSKKLWLSIFSFVVLLGGLTASVVLVQKRQLLEKRAAGREASITLPTQLNANPGHDFSVPVFIDTNEVNVSAIDVVLDFSADKDKISLVSIEPKADTATSLKTFTPVDADGNFDTAKVISNANTNGIVEFGAVTFDWTNNTKTDPFRGILGTSNPLAILTFRVNSQAEDGQAVIKITHIPGVTTDSNLVGSSTATDILANVNSLTANISASAPASTSAPAPSGGNPTPTTGSTNPTPTTGSTNPTPTTGSTNPTPTTGGGDQAGISSENMPVSYANSDYEQVIECVEKEECDTSAVSQWVRNANRTPGVQSSFCGVTLDGNGLDC